MAKGNRRKKDIKHYLPPEEQEELNEYLLKKYDEPVSNHEDYKYQNDFFKDRRIVVKCKTPGQKEILNSIKQNEITIVTGPAGTGKTYVACAQALKLLKASAKYDKILLAKSVTVLKDEEVGFLKGELEDKLAPHMFSFMSNFYKILDKATILRMKREGLIEYWPLAYIRGANVDDSILIIDEAQNISIDNIRTIMTRLGSNCKMVFLGDTRQIDMKKKGNSALEFIVENFKGIDGFGLVELSDEDVVRNPLIKKIEARFNEVLDNK